MYNQSLNTLETTTQQTECYVSELFQIIYKYSSHLYGESKKTSIFFNVAKSNHYSERDFQYLTTEKNYFLKGFGFNKTTKEVYLIITNDKKQDNISFLDYRNFLSDITTYVGEDKKNLRKVFDFEVKAIVINSVLKIKSEFSIREIVNKSSQLNENFIIVIH